MEPTFVCRRCDGCPLIIGDEFVKNAPTRFRRSKQIHKQSLGHPWPFRLLKAPRLPSTDGGLSLDSEKCMQMWWRGCAPRRKIRSRLPPLLQRLCEGRKQQKSFPGKSSGQLAKRQFHPTWQAFLGRVHYLGKRRGVAPFPSEVANKHRAKITILEREKKPALHMYILGVSILLICLWGHS